MVGTKSLIQTRMTDMLHSYLCVYLVLVEKDDYCKGKFRWPLLGRWVTYSYNTPEETEQ